MNKKGDVPITILVIGIFALCSLALFTFVVSDIRTSNSFSVFGGLSELNLEISYFEFLISQGVSKEKAASSLGAIEEERGLFLYKEENRSFFGGGGLEYSIKYEITD